MFNPSNLLHFSFKKEVNNTLRKHPHMFLPQVSPFYKVEKVKCGVLKMKVYFLVLTGMEEEDVVT